MANHNGQYLGAKYELSCNDLSVVLFTRIAGYIADRQVGWLINLLLRFTSRPGDKPLIDFVNITYC